MTSLPGGMLDRFFFLVAGSGVPLKIHTRFEGPGMDWGDPHAVFFLIFGIMSHTGYSQVAVH